ncbi:ROK family transcriptional regulator [Brachybacterium alimentarium]|uniref:ROK family transcriptional regulator n=1 Tax=Brachybacterium alimentarium TaxID=47845 RepID=UPI000DF2B28E|nr:ROK family transcriptional regulator [Brachybacterium alimentarium]RCS75024.1 ROK family transcriptional regulator [Brachybacterium alimentarium]
MSTAESAAGAAVRQGNARDCVLSLREASGPVSVAELAARTGLSRPTVDSVLQDLADSGALLLASPAVDRGGRPGRPARRFALDPSSATVAAVDLGERSVTCLVSDAVGTVLARTTVPAETGDHLAAAEEAVRGTGHAPQCLGLAVPGILAADGRIAQSLALPDLVGRDLAAELAQRLGAEVVVENDIKLAALAERHLGPPAESIAYVQIGHRISLALILDGRILQGSHRLAGELGSQRGMRWTSSSERGRLTWSTGDEAFPLLERAAAGDSAACQEIDAFCAEIAPRLATVLLTLDPELVVVGGGLSRAGETFLDPLRRNLHHLLMSPDQPDLVPARLTADGSLIGALGRAFEHGSARITGVVGVPAPWPALLRTPTRRTAS